VAAYANLAMLMLKCARIDAAIEACHRGLAIDPNSAELHFGLGRALSRRGDYREAADAFTELRWPAIRAWRVPIRA
jgi:tetratricopeptide (TPR) repeat protein